MYLKNASSALRKSLVRTRERLALWLAPNIRPRTSSSLLPGEELKLLTHVPLDAAALAKGIVKVRYRAFDPIWRDGITIPDNMIPLREHVARLCSVAHELEDQNDLREWHIITENLRLAASLNDLSADTDIYGDAQWCSTAAEYEIMNTEIASKYVACVITFNLVWTAYEAAVEITCTPSEKNHQFGKGARGRHVLLRIMENRHFPHLRQGTLNLLQSKNTPALGFANGNMRRAIKNNSFAAVAAEYLRCFRNAVAHGAITQPIPQDWGESSSYTPDHDPAISQFHYSIRTTLLLTQILIRSTLEPHEQLTGWLSSLQSGILLLTQLHCELPETDEFELPFDAAHFIDSNDDLR